MIAQERQKIRHLIVIKDRRGKRVIPLTEDTYSLGRSPENAIVLYGSSVSRQHATITRATTPSDKLAPFSIIDGSLKGIKSTNGLLINGNKCDHHVLRHGDFIEFGNTVKVTYYTLFNLLDREFTEFCEIENNSKVVKKSILASFAVPYSMKNIAQVDRQTLISLASFPELMPYPIIEIDLAGSITYCNPVAMKVFPKLKTLDVEHSVISGLPDLVQEEKVTHLSREIKFQSQFFAQSIQYLATEQKIRIFMKNITEEKEKAVIQSYSDLLLKEVITVSNLSLETRIQSLLQIGCDLFDLEIGFLGKLQGKFLKIATIYQKNADTCFLEKDQLWEISADSEDRSLRLFQFTLDDFEPVTLQYFAKIDSHHLSSSNQTLIAYRIPISGYLGVRLLVGNKTYGILSFLSPRKK
ncbi:FHA domain-containing protein, partial [Hyella patelloides]|uniref:FHA domain-containing protein n=1 Tax=Hyella patelloides TaxID=1982969 RepID=UPI0011AA3AEE